MSDTPPACGTYAAYQRHRKRGETACAECRRANADYIAAYRAKRPEVLDRDQQRREARERALRRLAELHPMQFQILLAQEDGQ